MANWKQTLRIDDVWRKRNGECGQEDWTDKTVHELAKEIARRLERKFPQYLSEGKSPDPNLMDIYEWFLAIPTLKQYQDRVNGCMSDPETTDEEYLEYVDNTPMNEFNYCMGLLYDWCDRNLVWVEK